MADQKLSKLIELENNFLCDFCICFFFFFLLLKILLFNIIYIYLLFLVFFLKKKHLIAIKMNTNAYEIIIQC